MKNKQIGPKGSRGDPPIASGSRGQPPWIFNDPWGELPELRCIGVPTNSYVPSLRLSMGFF